jgi:hypothetical protein
MKKITPKQLEVLHSVVDSNSMKGQTGWDDYNGLTIDFDVMHGHFTAEVGAVATSLANEVSRAQTAEAGLQGAINSLSSTVSSEVTRLEGLISDEEAARELAVQDLQDQLDAEIARAVAAENANASAISAEVTRATGEEARLEGLINSEASARAAADTGLAGDIAAEEAARISADNALQAAIDAEVARATAAEGVLQGNIDVEKGRIDAILDASTADKDSFAEIVALINFVDTDNDNAFAAYVLSNDAAVADLQSELDDTQAGAGLGPLGGYIVPPTSFYIGAATSLMGAIKALDTALDTEVQTIMGDLTTEVARLDGLVDTEEAARIAGDNALQTALTAEETARIAGDNALAADLLQERNDRIAADDAIVNGEATFSDLKLVGDELRDLASFMSGSNRAMNFYKEVQITSTHVDALLTVPVEMIFDVNVRTNSTDPSKEKINMGVEKFYPDFFVDSKIDISKVQIFLNGVLLEGTPEGGIAGSNDYHFVNQGVGQQVEIKFAQGILEEGDKLMVHMSFM